MSRSRRVSTRAMPAASRHFAHSRDQVLSFIGLACAVVNSNGTVRLTNRRLKAT